MSEVFLTGFNPTSISGLKEWFDASQTSSILSNGSGQVYQWNNLAGYANATQATTSYQPYTGNVTVNGLNAMYYTATSFITTGSISFTSQYRTLFQVVQVTTLSGVASYAFYSGTQMSIYQILFSDFEVNNHPAGNRMATVNPSASGGFIACPTNIYRVPYLLDVYAGSSATGFFINGSNCGALSPIAVFPIGTFTNAIGSNNTYGATPQPWYLCETLHYDADLTVAQRQLVEGYLAWKWGFQATLISTHPYYSVNPNKVPGFPTALQSLVTPLFTPLSIPGCALWFDGNDPLATGTAPANGTSLSTWVNKGTTSVTMAYGTSQPTFSSNFQNGLGSVAFNGNYFTGSYSFNLAVKSGFLVCSQSNSATDSPQGILSFYGSGGDTVASTNGFGYQATEGGRGSFGWLYNIFQSGLGAASPSTGYYIQTGTAGANTPLAIYGNVMSNQYEQAFVNGTNNSNFTITTTPGTSTTLMLGARWLGGARGSLYGNICEVIVYNVGLTATQRQQVEGYLANKWGLKSSLLSTHPYYSIAPTTTVPLAITQPYPPASAQIFSYTGANQTYTVPSGAISLTVYMWGAGGGSGFGGNGGAGAYVQGTLSVTPGSSLTVIVGQGGSYNGGSTYGNGGQSSFQYGYNGGKGSGGGRSAIQLSGTELVDAGGGGGGANGGSGGCANYSPTINGGAAYSGTGSGGGGTAGTGGTQSAGGTQGTNPIPQGTNGSYLQGGIGTAGGGGGYYGGGGGGYDNAAGGFGAGGGSSYTTNAAFKLGSGGNSPNLLESAPGTGSSYYLSGVAVGGVPYGSGGNGLVVIVPIMITPPAALLPIATTPNTASITTIVATGAATYTVPAGASGVYVYLWGGAGGYGNQPNGVGGSGGFVSGFYACGAGTVLSYVIGNSLAYGTSGGTPTILNGGGGSCPGGGNVVGGGFAGIFNAATTGAVTQANAIAIAGAGGASGQYAYGYGGGGAYPMGNSPTNLNGGYAYGGSQLSAGVGSVGSGSGINGGAGGGGGYYGGGSAAFGAGAGGSSYIAGLTSGAYYENGSNATATTQTILPGGYTSKYYVSPYGQSSATAYNNGLIVIIPALPATPTFQITTPPNSQVATTLSYTGSYITYTVPTNIISLQAYAWGAGGAGFTNSGLFAGGGALLYGSISVSGGEQLRVIVGKGGTWGSNTSSNYFATGTDAQGAGGGGGGNGGQGGGRSAIQKYISGSWVEVLTAGGGGGGALNAGDSGGNAYYTGTSQDAGNTYNQYTSAKGGSQSAGGLGAQITGRTPYNYPSNNGAAFVGGTALLNTDGQGGGGGGGGYYGGGGGGYNGGAEVSGGGGGSSYYNPTYVTNFGGINGANLTAIGTGIAYYDGQAGIAQASSTVPARNGLVAFVATVGLQIPFQAVTTGGTITYSGAYRIHKFTTTGASTFTTNKTITVQVLVVGGGGGGGGDWGGGGGGGGAILTSLTLTAANSPYSLVVGTGGASSTSGVSSTFTAGGTTYTGLGGGAGGLYSLGNGSSGGCGGGGGAGYNGSSTGGSATQADGFAGGGVTNGGINTTPAAGGGGMGSAGMSSAAGGHGGNGKTFFIGGASYTFAGGGGAGSGNGSPPGLGQAGGVNGGTYTGGGGLPGIAALPNTGSGGGGTSIAYIGNGGVGGSGIVIIAILP